MKLEDLKIKLRDSNGNPFSLEELKIQLKRMTSSLGLSSQEPAQEPAYKGAYPDLESLFGKAEFVPNEDVRGLIEQIRALKETLEATRRQPVEAIIDTENPGKPQQPLTRVSGGTVKEWLLWYEAMLDNGYACSEKEVAHKSGWTYGYIRQRWSAYNAKPHLKAPNKHRTKN